MHVILEGPDGCGKSTMAEYLKDKYDLKIIHNTAAEPNTLLYYLSLCDDNIVLDRANLSEYIYSDIYERDCRMNMTDQIEFFAEYNGKCIICYASNFKDLKTRFEQRGDTIEVTNNLEKINSKYKDLALLLEAIFPNIYALDISKYSTKEAMINYLEGVLNEKH